MCKSQSPMAGKQQTSLVCALLFVIKIAYVSCSKIRGLDPRLEDSYSDRDGHFKCLDGSATIPFTKVNDNYCDCLDGSDEPGTSACSNGRFYCKNRGHQPLLLNSSFVDDGVCDCCDGTDEQLSGRHCPNTCKQAGAAAREFLAKAAKDATEGVKQRQKLVREAKLSNSQWQSRLDVVKHKLAAQEKLRDEAQGEKDRLEAIAKKAEETERAAREAAEKAAPAVDEQAPAATSDADAAASMAEEAAAAGGGGAAEEGAAPQPPESGATGTGAREVFDGEAHEAEGETAAAYVEAEEVLGEHPGDEGTPAAEEPVEEEKTAEQLARERLSQWVHQDAGDAESADELGGEDEPDLDLSEDEVEHLPLGEAEDAHGDVPPAATAEPETSGKAGSWVQRVKSLFGLGPKPSPSEQEKRSFDAALEAARNAYNKENTAVSELQTEQTELEKKLGYDYGPDKQFLGLQGRCLTATVDKYTYEVCPYDHAAQKEGHSSTRLGNWAGFEEDYKYMKFEHGAGCWQGPSRSLKVHLVCGAVEEVTRVEEPSRCTYQARLATPAACSQAEADRLAQQVQAAETEADAHDEL